MKKPTERTANHRTNRPLARRIGRALQDMREKKGWSRLALAAKLGLCTFSLFRLERGLASPPLPLLHAVCRALGTRVSVVCAEVGA